MAPSAGNRQRNSTSLVDKPVQFTLIWRVMMHWTLFVSVGVIVGLAHAMFEHGGLATDHLQSVLSKQIPFLFIALLMLPIFMLDTFKLSQRFVGPMVRLRRGMQQLTAGGNSPSITLRPGDVWSDLAYDFNRLAARMQLVTQWENNSLSPRQLASELAIHESYWVEKETSWAAARSAAENVPVPAAGDEEPGRDQRRSIFVDDPVQGAMMRRVLGHWLAYLLVSCLLGIALTWMLDPLGGTSLAFLNYLQSQGPGIVAAAGLIMIFAWDIVAVTHRIAGPMVQLRRQMKVLSLGQPAQRVAFRPKDFWHDVAHDFNAMCDRVEPRMIALQQYIQQTPVATVAPVPGSGPAFVGEETTSSGNGSPLSTGMA